jgi:hypothetical protein
MPEEVDATHPRYDLANQRGARLLGLAEVGIGDGMLTNGNRLETT